MVVRAVPPVVVVSMRFCKRKCTSDLLLSFLIFPSTVRGQQFAQQMQEANPELVEQLKSAFKKPGGGDNQGDNPDKGQS